MKLTSYYVTPEYLMPQTVAEDFLDISRELTDRERRAIDTIVRSTVDPAWQAERHWGFSAPAKVVDKEIARTVAWQSEEDRHRLRRRGGQVQEQTGPSQDQAGAQDDQADALDACAAARPSLGAGDQP